MHVYPYFKYRIVIAFSVYIMCETPKSRRCNVLAHSLASGLLDYTFKWNVPTLKQVFEIIVLISTL